MYILTFVKRYIRIYPDTYGNACACMQGALRQSLKVPGLNPIMFLTPPSSLSCPVFRKKICGSGTE